MHLSFFMLLAILTHFSFWFHFLICLFENTHIYAQIISSDTKIVIFICKLRLQTPKRVYKNPRTVYEYVNILFNQVYEWVPFFEDHVYDWGRF